MPDPGEPEITVEQLRREAAAYDRGRSDAIDDCRAAVRGARDGHDAELRIIRMVESDEKSRERS